jgi:hypothetical protein
MIKLRNDISPSADTLAKLDKFQKTVDDEGSFEKRSAKAKVLFPKKNIKTNTAFKQIKLKLTALCNSTRRCVYCEDSFADEVEHIYPKDLFPEKCFKWENYVYACGPCNGPKNNKFAIFRNSDGEFTVVNPPKGAPATEPPAGDAAMINPRIENPLDYAILDLAGTFKFIPLPDLNPKDNKKAEYTFNDILRLNDAEREPLRQARENAYGMYKARLYEYVRKKDDNAPQAKLDKLIGGIKMENHPTVWKEMIRYFKKGYLVQVDIDLNNLFNKVPEALNW